MINIYQKYTLVGNVIKSTCGVGMLKKYMFVGNVNKSTQGLGMLLTVHIGLECYQGEFYLVNCKKINKWYNMKGME